MANEDWTQDELDASVKVYLEMLSKEKSGIKYVKADYNRKSIAGALKGRSNGAFERRMANILRVINP